MKAAFTLDAQARDKIGKGASRALRREGKLPAVLYGKGQAPLSFTLDHNNFMTHYLRGGITNKLVEIKLDGKSHHVLPREIQIHPVSDVPEHLDFLVVDEKSRVKVDVPVKLLNAEKCAGVKLGGSLNIVRHAIELICAPDAIPPVIKVDVKDLEIGDSLHISAVTLPDGVENAITDRDFTILTVSGRMAETKVEEEEGEEAAEGAEGEEAPAAEGGEEAPAEEAKPEE